MKGVVFFILGLTLGLTVFSPIAFGEIFSLRTGGTVEGTLRLPYDDERKIWHIETKEGIVLELEHRTAVSRIFNDPSRQLVSYENASPFYENTVENHWDLARKCKTYNLNRQAELHYRQVIELDPDHAEARKALGYTNYNGVWLTKEEERSGRGYVFKNGKWVTSQQSALDENRLQQKQENSYWKKEMARLVDALHGRDTKAAVKEMYAIRDGAAIPVIADCLRNEKDADLRIIYLKTLEKIGTADALLVIASVSMDDPVGEVRATCMDLLKQHPGMTRYYTRFLHVSDNAMVNQAGQMLERLGNKDAIPELINALVTKHTETVVAGSSGYNIGFDNRGGSGLNLGTSETKVTKDMKNQDVLRALKKLTGVDYGYDIPAWLDWYRNQRRVSNYNSRRGSVD